MTDFQHEDDKASQTNGVRIGILGGTFDPVHFGHLFIAAEASCRFQLDRVLFIPNGNPPHKSSRPLTAAHHRAAMVRLATAPNSRFQVSSIEIEREGPSYTIDTLCDLRAESPDADLYYIMGADAVADLLTWRRHGELMKYASFIAFSRPGFTLSQVTDRLPCEYRRHIHLMEAPALGISSTDIRRRVADGASARYLLPDSVLDYIVVHRLYREPASPGESG